MGFNTLFWLIILPYSSLCAPFPSLATWILPFLVAPFLLSWHVASVTPTPASLKPFSLMVSGLLSWPVPTLKPTYIKKNLKAGIHIRERTSIFVFLCRSLFNIIIWDSFFLQLFRFPFSLQLNEASRVCAMFSWSIPSAYRHLGWFHFLAVVNRASVHMEVWVPAVVLWLHSQGQRHSWATC